MITERPLYGRVDVETPDFDQMGFVLDMSILGDSLGDGSTEEAWRSLIDHATNLHIFRGGQRTGVGIKTDVGLATIQLYNAEDPLAGGDIQPGQFIRVTADGEPIFTGRIADIATAYRRNRTTGQLEPFVQVTAADAVQIHTTTPRFGARPPAGFETFEERITRLTQSARTAVDPPPLNDPVEVYTL
jgi:hypothetical protein